MPATGGTKSHSARPRSTTSFEDVRASDPTEVTLLAAEAESGATSRPRSGGNERFEYLEVIGAGGSGSVHRVRDRNLKRVVAMKVLEAKRAAKQGHADRFLREAQIHAQLDHPNIVPVHELVMGAGQPMFFIMKLVDGRTMRQWVESVGRPRGSLDDLHEMLLAFLKVCDAVALAHSRGIIHCDIKPENVMVGTFGQVYLVDWGIARVLSGKDTGLPRAPRSAGAGKPPGLTGTIQYMSPEHIAGNPARLGRHTDVFGLGGLLFFLLTGRAPYGGLSRQVAVARAGKGQWRFPPPKAGEHLPPPLVRVVERAMAADPADRYFSVLELKKSVESFLSGGFAFPAQTFRPGARIVVEGDPGDCAFIITSGSCLVYRTVGGKRKVLRTLGPDAVFGEMAVLAGGKRTATVEAIDEVTVKVVTREALETNLGLDTCFGAFVRAIAQRFAEKERGGSAD
jgi:serine/threonine-protein kinase